jgi:hypothetical protein
MGYPVVWWYVICGRFCPFCWLSLLLSSQGLYGSVLGAGDMLQAGRSKAPFPMKSAHFSFGLTFPAELWFWEWTQLRTEMHTRNVPELTEWPTLKAHNLILSQFSKTCGTLCFLTLYSYHRDRFHLLFPNVFTSLSNAASLSPTSFCTCLSFLLAKSSAPLVSS